MPYFIYKVFSSPIRRLEKVEEHPRYRDAASAARQLRSTLASDAPYIIKLIFGETELHAEDALNEIREPNPEPDE
jgi:hypothetical protein